MEDEDKYSGKYYSTATLEPDDPIEEGAPPQPAIVLADCPPTSSSSSTSSSSLPSSSSAISKGNYEGESESLTNSSGCYSSDDESGGASRAASSKTVSINNYLFEGISEYEDDHSEPYSPVQLESATTFLGSTSHYVMSEPLLRSPRASSPPLSSSTSSECETNEDQNDEGDIDDDEEDETDWSRLSKITVSRSPTLFL